MYLNSLRLFLRISCIVDDSHMPCRMSFASLVIRKLGFIWSLWPFLKILCIVNDSHILILKELRSQKFKLVYKYNSLKIYINCLPIRYFLGVKRMQIIILNDIIFLKLCSWFFFLKYVSTLSDLSSYDRNGWSFKRMNWAGKGRSCRGEGGSLLLLLFADKKYEGHGSELGKIWIGKLVSLWRDFMLVDVYLIMYIIPVGWMYLFQSCRNFFEW